MTVKTASLRTLEDAALLGKVVLLRVDFNVPVVEGKIADLTRIQQSVATIHHLIEKGAKVLLVTHLGRPKGKVDPKFSTQILVDALETALIQKISFFEDVKALNKEALLAMKTQVALAENIRFYPEETSNESLFAKHLASLADIYVCDAFGAVHRAHASIVGPSEYIPAFPGLLLEKELSVLGEALESPKSPFVAMIGGAKISTKFDLMSSLLGKVDTLIIGGGMVYTLLAAQGKEVGNSLIETDLIEKAKHFLEKAAEVNTKVILPVDHVIADAFSNEANTKTVAEIESGWMALDIGPQTVALIESEIKAAQLILWNGPFGVFELSNFSAGTLAIAKATAAASAYSIVGGGDSVSAINQSGVSQQINHISTGGGAALEFLEGKALPGVVALNQNT